MILSAVSIFLVFLIAYIWLTRGFFSALIHFLCTIIAGAFAFALWEPLGYAILGGTSSVGFIDGSAWGLALIVPFAVSLVLFRFIADRVLRSNVIVSGGANYAGGALLGAMSGAISVGIAVISLSYLRVDFVGPQSFDYSPTGSVVRNSALWVPFDKMTARLYGHLSERALRSDESLAKWHPAIHEMGSGMRISPFDNAGRNTFRPGDFELRGRFVVGGEGHQFSEVLKDTWNNGVQSVVDPQGDAYPPDTRIEGVIITFQAPAREKDGRVAIGAPQIMMVSENSAGERDISFPFAVTTQADPATPGAARFRFDSGGTFIASIGSASEATMAFEFPCRSGFNPVAVYVKGARLELTTPASKTFATFRERDAGGLAAMGVGNPAALPTGTTGNDTTVQTQARPGQPVQIPDVSVSNAIPMYNLQEGQHGTLQLGEGSQWHVVSGELTATVEEARKWQNVTERKLRITQFAASSDRVMVQIRVDSTSRVSLLGRTLDAAEAILPPLLVDTQGETYEPVGYIYEDETMYKLRFDPARPIRAMSEMPNLSRSRPQQRLILIFQVSFGRSIKSFNKGQKVMYDFNPPIPCDVTQRTN
ncbi:MAG: CvpA family protein [Phycisphaerales bacterium]|nr:CvpA family protein [Phycisphaerales bacterium]